ncbi:hypothetical protein PF005_g30966 [Phytophthora fragariae]|uniref:Uncharacterized protein n=1 Tax=Phytophthora fragariae TaxID=53985 RepID=A0A6A3VB49_9STRA|nr:hypothetical protein PF003_g17070 [Phytophthora fragariae]KAE8920823.1 hypothetical protein PF009_g28888 [Phytophthora fragariae]KAE9060378.1 hypothetical protein PF007_g30634 [Phytophthora fragariae]KAE9162158.1 hypothetical protein PF005_g30966 [Phytophthora fragariae]
MAATCSRNLFLAAKPKTIGAAATSLPSKPLQQSCWPSLGLSYAMPCSCRSSGRSAPHTTRRATRARCWTPCRHQSAQLLLPRCRRSRSSSRAGLVLVTATICNFSLHFTKLSTAYDMSGNTCAVLDYMLTAIGVAAVASAVVLA